MPVEIVIWHVIFLQLMEKSREQLRSVCLWWTFGVTTQLGIHDYILHPTYKTNQQSTAHGNYVDDNSAEGSAPEAVVDEEQKIAESIESTAISQIDFFVRCAALLFMATSTIMVCIIVLCCSQRTTHARYVCCLPYL